MFFISGQFPLSWIPQPHRIVVRLSNENMSEVHLPNGSGLVVLRMLAKYHHCYCSFPQSTQVLKTQAFTARSLPLPVLPVFYSDQVSWSWEQPERLCVRPAVWLFAGVGVEAGGGAMETVGWAEGGPGQGPERGKAYLLVFMSPWDS